MGPRFTDWLSDFAELSPYLTSLEAGIIVKPVKDSLDLWIVDGEKKRTTIYATMHCDSSVLVLHTSQNIELVFEHYRAKVSLLNIGVEFSFLQFGVSSFCAEQHRCGGDVFCVSPLPATKSSSDTSESEHH